MPISNEEKVSKIVRDAHTLFGNQERTNSENLWSELTEFMLNNQYGNFTTNASGTFADGLMTGISPGTKKTTRVYDSTALQAVQDLAASFQSTLTNPATKWSRIKYKVEQLNDNEEAARWLDAVNDKIHAELSESNFDTEIGRAYQSLISLANMALFQDEVDGEMVFTCYHLGQIAWSTNKNGLVDRFYRKFTLTVTQAVEKWGKNVHPEVLRLLEEKPFQELSFMQCVFPRDKKDVKLNDVGLAPGENRPYADIYIDLKHKHIVSESGYYEFPLHVARWSIMPGENYGRGPGHYALPDVRTLNHLKMRALESLDRQVRPPLLVNQRDILGGLDLRAGKMSVVRDINGLREFETRTRNDVIQMTVEELKNSIRSIFYLDKLLLPPRNETGEMTAFEVNERIQQMHRVLGPTLSRLNSELLQPLILRTFKILLRRGALPKVPDMVLEYGADVEIVFVNALARAQQSEELINIQQVFQMAGLLAQLEPGVVQNLNADNAIREIAKVIGVSESVVRPRDEVEQIREQQAQAIQQQQMMEQANLAADTAAKAGITGGGANGGGTSGL